MNALNIFLIIKCFFILKVPIQWTFWLCNGKKKILLFFFTFFGYYLLNLLGRKILLWNEDFETMWLQGTEPSCGGCKMLQLFYMFF